MLKAGRWQLRMGMNGPYGLDHGAIMLTAQARGAASALLAEVLPDVEAILIHSLRRPDDMDQDGEG